MNTLPHHPFRKIIAAAATLLLLAASLSASPVALSSTGPLPAQQTNDDTFTPILAALSIDQYPLLGQAATLACEVSTAIDAPGTTVQIELPEGARVISGSPSWQGDLPAAAPLRVEAGVVFDTPGEKTILCRALSVIDAENTWGDVAELYLTVGADRSMAGFDSAALLADGGMEQIAPGDGIPSEADPRLLPAAPGDAGLQPPSLDPMPEGSSGAPVASPGNETLLGNLTVTGKFTYHDRNNASVSAEKLVAIVTGNTILAWCYSGLDGSFSCGPFANPGTAVYARWYAWTKYNPYADILTVVNPDVGTSNSEGNAWTVWTDAFTYTDGTHNIGSWFISDENRRHAFWLSTDLTDGWRYVAFATGFNQNPVETTGQGTIQWKPDSTDGTYYSYGGNMHLTGQDAFSNTVANHEYGHNMMWTIYGATFPFNDCPSPHYIQLTGGPHCGWTEGWADFFPMAVNNDPFYRWGSGSSLNLETPTWGTATWINGDQVEGRVAGSLWDMYDSADDGDDTYSEGDIVDIWDTIYHQNDNTFYEYWTAWQSRGHNNSSWGPIMDMYQNTINYRLGPANDDFANAQVMGASPYTVTGLSTPNATTQGKDPATTCGSTTDPHQGRSVWYRFTPPLTGDYSVKTTGSNYDTVLAVWTGAWGALTQRACNDDALGGAQSLAVLSMTGGTPYYIEAMAFGATSGGSLNLKLCQVPYTPVLTGPADGTVTNATSTTFTWDTSTGADSYAWQFSDQADFSNLLATYNGNTPAVTLNTNDGLYYWRVAALNNASGCSTGSAWTAARTIRIDRTAPTVSITINGGAAYTNSGAVTLTHTASDGGSGVDQMRNGNYLQPWGPWEAYSATKAWTLDPTGGDGIKRVYVQIRDHAMNLSGQVYDTITLDTAPPTGTVSINGGAAFTGSTTVTLNLSASDTLSGMGEMRIANTGTFFSAWEPYAATKTWTLTSGDGTKTVQVDFRDNAGNIARTVTDTILLDATAPTGTVSINGGASVTSVPGVTLALSASDAGTGISQMRFSNNNADWSSWEAYGASKAWTLSAGDGTKTVYVQFRDAAQNGSANVTDTIALDTTGPTGTIAINSGAEYTLVPAVTLTLSATDAISTVAQMRFSPNNADWGAWEPYATSRAWTLPGGDGGKTVYVQFRDSLNNASTSFSDTIKLDATGPTGTVLVNSGAPYTNSTTVTVALTGNDAGSAVSQMRFSDDGSNWSPWELFAASKSWPIPAGDGPKTIYAQLNDLNGNPSTSLSDGIDLDATPPTSAASAPAIVTTPAFLVTWTGSDALSGIVSYDVQYRVGSGGTWTNWLVGVATTEASFGGGSPLVLVPGETYYFRVRARDAAGNVEAYPDGDGDTATIVGRAFFLPLIDRN